MTILGIGVDVVHVPRIAAVLNKRHADRFVKKILSPNEYTGWLSIAGSSTPTEAARYIAVRWSVKEAAYKALYPHARPTWKDLTYTGLNAGTKPSLTYTPSPSSFGPIHVSVSHDGEYVFAQVLVERGS